VGFRIIFELDLFKGPHEAELSQRVLQVMLDSLYKVDCLYLQANPNTPRIYSPNLVTRKPRIHYEREDEGRELWQDIPTTLALGEGDCEDLACWRAAELTMLDKIPCTPTFTVKPRASGGMLYHILVKHPDGTLEDPSRKLGM
jgi:hypothetical protein